MPTCGMQVIDKVPQSQLRRGKQAGKSPLPPEGSRQRLAKKLRINPLTLKGSSFALRAVKPKVRVIAAVPGSLKVFL
jgi:hypothetical protein